MAKLSLVDRAVLSRADEQCEDEFFRRAPRRVRQICTTCLKNEVEVDRGWKCAECKKKVRDHYNKVSPSRVARLKNKGLLRRYVEGKL